MSIVFSGLERVEQGSSDQLNWFYFDATDVTTVEGVLNPTRLVINDEQEILLSQCFDSEYYQGASDDIITTCEKFLINGQKMIVLENAIFFVPRIFLCFRPGYACQLSIRFIVKLLTGIDESAGVEFVIRKNVGNLVRYFKNIQIVSEFVHTGKTLDNPSQFSAQLTKEIMMSLVEYFSMQICDEFFNVAVSHLIRAGDSSSILNNDQQIRTCEESVYKNLRNMEICMFTADFCCVICSQHFSRNTELKTHIKEHSQLSCLECQIKFNSYEYLLVHKLTFCHTPCLLKNCLYCEKPASECICGKLHLAWQKAIRLWMHSEKENKCLQIGLYSMIYNYLIQENDEFNLEKLPEETGNEDWTQTVVDTIVASVLPKIVLENDAVIIDNTRISFHKIKELIEDFFLTFEEFESYILDFAIPIKELCGESSCKDRFSKTHILENHPVCSFARNFRSNEVPVRYTTKKDLYLHLIDHKILVKLPMRCKICNFRFKMLNSHLLLCDVFNHAKHHGKQEKMHCVFNTELSCQVLRPVGSLDEILHNFMFHSGTNMLQVFQNVLTFDEECSKSPARNRSISFGEIHQQEVDELQHSTDCDNHSIRSQVEENKYCNSLTSEDKEKFQCKNEKHVPPIDFQNELLLQIHIFETHKCPACKFSTMLDRDLLEHLKSHASSSQQKCDICNLFVKNLREHTDRMHAKCSACKTFFVDLQQLKAHEPNCSVLKDEKVLQSENAVIQKNLASLQIDSSELESSFSQILIKMLEKSNCDEREKLLGASIIQKFASESTITKNRARLENVSVRKSDASFFDTPSFRHDEKSNLPKVLAAVGSVSDKVRFDGKSEHAKTQAVKNFELFDIIFSRMEKNILLGSLSELQAVSVLQLYLSQRITDEICSYTNIEWKFLSYTEIIKTIQFLYIPLNLEIFQNLVLSYRIDKNESFLEFSSRVFRHLKLCSRLKSPDERVSYVELHRCSILKNNLPSDTLNVITRKEQIYRPFSSQELLDHVISSYHLAANENESEQYHVFFTQKNTGEIPAAAQIRTLEQNNEARRKPGESKAAMARGEQSVSGLGKTERQGTNRDTDPPARQRVNRGNLRRASNREYRQSGRKDHPSQLRRDGQAGIRRDVQAPTNTRYNTLADVPPGTCVKCLSNNHLTTACPIYQHAAICRSLCLVNAQAHGFHHRQDCTVKRNLTNNRGQRTADFYQNRNRSSRVFRPFRIQK